MKYPPHKDLLDLLTVFQWTEYNVEMDFDVQGLIKKTKTKKQKT